MKPNRDSLHIAGTPRITSSRSRLIPAMGPQERDPRLAPLLIGQLLSIEDCGCDKARRAGLHARDHVGVLLHGERWRLMAEAFTDHLHRYPRLECDRGMSVSKVMQPNPWQ